MKSASVLLFGLTLCSSFAQAEDWTGFRGPNSSGVSNDKNVPVEWSDTKNLAWKLDLPGKGYSSPIVVGDSVFVTCYTKDEGLSKIKRFLIRIDRKSGSPVWTKEVPATEAEQAYSRIAGDPGYAVHTPVTDGKHVYAMFGNSGMHAFDMDGEIKWTKKLGKENRARFGSASSPVLYNDMLILQASSESETIYGLNKATGEEIWKVPAQPLSQSYSTPILAKSDNGVDELLVGVANEMWSLDPNNKGKLNWYASTNVPLSMCPVIVAKDGIAYCVGGRGGGRTAIRLGGKDDVGDSHRVWQTSGSTYVPSPVIVGEHLYFVNDTGNVTCVDLKDGKSVGRQRLGGRFYASITAIGDKLYAVSRYSGTHVIEATPELKKLANNKLSDDSDHSASPAVSDGQLFIRSNKAIYCIGKSE